MPNYRHYVGIFDQVLRDFNGVFKNAPIINNYRFYFFAHEATGIYFLLS